MAPSRLVAQALAQADRSFGTLPEPEALTEEALLGALDRAGESLAAVHGMEVLMGMLPPSAGAGGPTGLGTAAGLLARLSKESGRVPGRDDDLVAAHPVLLALLPPRIGERAPLLVTASSPDAASAPGLSTPTERHQAAVALARESLRMPRSLASGGPGGHGGRAGPAPAARRGAGRPVVGARAAPDRVGRRPDRTGPRRPGRAGPLVQRSFDAPAGVVPAGGGRFTHRRAPPGERVEGGGLSGLGGGCGVGGGQVVHDPDAEGPGSVLATATLDPRLAPLVPRLAGMVAATGSPLSHLAIVAREAGVPVVVRLRDALELLPVGMEALSTGSPGRYGWSRRASPVRE